MNLTARQTDVVTRLRDYRRQHGYAPTIYELGDSMGISHVTVFGFVDALVRKGVLKRDRYRARSLAIVDDSAVPAAERATQLAVLGVLSAGSPIDAVENRECLDLEQFFASRSGVYALRVRGDSFAEHHICHGDELVIERRQDARRGERVLATDAMLCVSIVVWKNQKDLAVKGVILGVLRSSQ